jgi:hypothetical protein
MNGKVEIIYYNDVHMKVLADPDIRQEIKEYFKFRPLNYQFNPSFKNKVWDGWLYLYSPFNPVMYVGLLHYVLKFCKDRDYEVSLDKNLVEREEFDDDYAFQLAKEINSPYQPRDYQNDYVVHCLREGRALVIAPTACLDPQTLMEVDLDEEAAEFLNLSRLGT